MKQSFPHHLPEENYFDLEDITDLARLTKPKLALENLEDLIIIDEIQLKWRWSI